MQKFVENGIEDLETVLELTDTHLDAMQIPMGYKLKIIKKIKTLRQDCGMSVTERSQQSRCSVVQDRPPNLDRSESQMSLMSVESTTRPFVQ